MLSGPGAPGTAAPKFIPKVEGAAGAGATLGGALGVQVQVQV